MEPSSSSSSSSTGVDEEEVEQTKRGPEQSIDSEETKNLASSEETLSNRQCRICYAPEEASGADPILLLGCSCKGDIGYGHQSCLKKWFHKRFRRIGNLDCEVCRSPLGARLKKIIRSFTTAEVIQHAPQLLLLLQVPPEELDHLQVPVETPGFYQLPSETRRSLEASLERLAQEQRSGESRRREAFETAQMQSNIAAAAADREPSSSEVLQHEEDVDYLNGLLFDHFLELSEVHVAALDLDTLVARVFVEHPHPHIYTHDQISGWGEDTNHVIGRLGYPEGPVIRTPILEPEDRVHPSRMEDLLHEVAMQAARVVDSYGEDLTLLPNYLDNLFIEEDDEPLSVPAVSEFRDNAVDIPVAIPVLTNYQASSGGPDPVFAEAARLQTDSIPSRRSYTYARFQMFQLLQ